MKKKKYMLIKSIIIVLGVVMLLWFALPAVSIKINYGTVTGTVIAIILVAYGLYFDKVNTFIMNFWKKPLGKAIEILFLLLAAVIIILAAATSAAMIKGAATTAEPESTVIVLGARLYSNTPSRTMLARCDAAWKYLVDNPESKCIVSGGQGSDEKRSEASAMFDILVNKGIDPERIFIEDQSADTDENMRFSKKIIDDNNLNPTVVLATNDYHEYRAITYAKAAGLNAGAVPAKTLWWIWPTSVVREMYGILEMWLLK